jgi:hypothetical protein
MAVGVDCTVGIGVGCAVGVGNGSRVGMVVGTAVGLGVAVGCGLAAQPANSAAPKTTHRTTAPLAAVARAACMFAENRL